MKILRIGTLVMIDCIKPILIHPTVCRVEARPPKVGLGPIGRKSNTPKEVRNGMNKVIGYEDDNDWVVYMKRKVNE